jgi:electron transfer flavoprotein beta subunit
MRTVMPALQRAKATKLAQDGLRYLSVTPPKQLRQTRVVKDLPAEDIARELFEWVTKE